MTKIDALLFFIIHFVVPVLGIWAFLSIAMKMRNEKIVDPPILELFFTFATYEGLLLLILTALFWKASGMALIGMFYSTFIAPILMIAVSYNLRSRRELSKYHNWTFIYSLAYFGFLLGTIFVAFWVEEIKSKNIFFEY